MKKQLPTAFVRCQFGLWSILSLFLSIGLAHCSSDDQGTDIRDFFYPIETLDSGLVYEYQSAKGDRLAPEYWYHLAVKQGDEQLFISNFYNYQLEVEQLAVEQVVESGSLMKEYKLYEADSMGLQRATDVQIVQPNVFPFFVRDSTVAYIFHIEWHDAQHPDWKTTLIRNRRYLGETTAVVDGQTLPAVRFMVQDLIETKQDGYQEIRVSGYELYAKGIGLVYYEKQIGEDGPSLAYELVDRYPMKQLEALHDLLNR